MSSRPFFVTTPIYYVNDAPHIGHAYTTVACDIAARFARLDGRETFFLTGTDEHGQKVARAAEKKGTDPQAFTDEVSQRFRRLVQGGENILHVSNNDFIRTTEERHKISAQELWKRLEAREMIYKSAYKGWYSVRDEAYYDESELVDGKAPTGAEVEWTEEESYFFRLGAMQDRLLDFYEAHPGFVNPKARFNEVISFVRGGKEKVPGALKDLSISRTAFSWGVPVPGDDTHVMYVWIDALMNYLSALGYPDDGAPLYRRFWHEESGAERVHVVGKDILRFHAVYWPAFLLAAELPVPDRIFAHGWWTVEGEKMSKSLGNVISPDELLEMYGADRTRYFLFREMPFGNDGNFSRTRAKELTDTELANKIGNLAQRSLSMLHKHFGGTLPDAGAEGEKEQALLQKAYDTRETYASAMRDLRFHDACGAIVQLAAAANEYIDGEAPWKSVKEEDKTPAARCLNTVAECVRCIALYLLPFTPDAAEKLLDVLNIPEDERLLASAGAAGALTSGHNTNPPAPPFPAIGRL